MGGGRGGRGGWRPGGRRVGCGGGSTGILDAPRAANNSYQCKFMAIERSRRIPDSITERPE